MNVIQAAQKHAQSMAQEGQKLEYDLRLTLYDGSQIQGKAAQPDSGVCMFIAQEGDGNVHVLFLNIDHVMTAEVIVLGEDH